MLQRGIYFWVVILILLGSGIFLNGQQKEDLLFEEIPVVITAARKEQPITQSPATITVIDWDDIRLSGANSIPDVLRAVAGVDVMSISLRDKQVGVRGLNGAQNNKLLVMVDGRSVYEDFYGSVFWEMFPVSLEEIQRIEIVKSPVSSLYGANAYSGVVNIITKTPEQMDGFLWTAVGGNYNSVRNFFGMGKKFGDTGIKLSGELNWAYELNSDTAAAEIYKINGLFRHRFNAKSEISFSIGRARTDNQSLFLNSDIGTGIISGRWDYLRLDYRFSNLRFRTYLNRLDATLNIGGPGGEQPGYTTIFDFELLHSFKFGSSHSVIWGVNYRNNYLGKSDFFLSSHKQSLWALFFEDEIRLSDTLRFTIGGRYDRHPLVGGHFSPRGNLFYSPSPDHTIRLSLASAFRNPAFVNSYVLLNYRVSLPSPQPPQLNIPFTFTSQGNENLEAEGILAYEIGYQARFDKRATIDLNLFYNRYSNLFYSSREYIYYETGEIFPGSPGGIIPKQLITSFLNGSDTWGIGGEAGVNINLDKNLSAFLNYSYAKITQKEPHPNATGSKDDEKHRRETPRHKINAGIRLNLPAGLALNATMHWVDKTYHRQDSIFGAERLIELDGHLMVNARLGFTSPSKHMEYWLAIFNMFNDEHYEFPPLNLPARDSIVPVGRRFYLGIRYKW